MKKVLLFSIPTAIIFSVLLVMWYLAKQDEKERDLRAYINNTTFVLSYGLPEQGHYYHLDYCKMSSAGKQVYSLSVSEAMKAGLIPCPYCKPPAPLLAPREKKEFEKLYPKIIEGQENIKDLEIQEAATDYLNGVQSPNSKYKVIGIEVKLKEGEKEESLNDYIKRRQRADSISKSK